ncbi:copper chaperone PCu(A)C [Chitinivorax sp. PXF-14]|uniref:copper chaperone PCu(A)C n=1 Tax=Chitinivorax sp. PXF-14 TaxID=3230488 RepID=UPI00346773E9
MMKSRLLSSLLMASCLALGSLAQAHQYKAGDLGIDHPWARATVPGATTGAVYLQVRNTGKNADTLLSASGPELADKVEVHSHVIDNGVAKMRPVPQVSLPAGEAVTFKPGGLHIMLMGLKAPLQQGQKLPLTLKFERAGEVKVEVKVEPLDVDAEAMHKH